MMSKDFGSRCPEQRNKQTNKEEKKDSKKSTKTIKIPKDSESLIISHCRKAQ
jgi:hypothetical protein